MSGAPGVVGYPPPHYATEGGLQPFDVIDVYGLGFYDGNALKYLIRARKKGDEAGDLRKALHYLDETLIRWEESGGRRWGPGVVTGNLTPGEVAHAFGLTRNVFAAVMHLLHWRLCDETGCLQSARHYAEKAVAESQYQEPLMTGK